MLYSLKRLASAIFNKAGKAAIFVNLDTPPSLAVKDENGTVRLYTPKGAPSVYDEQVSAPVTDANQLAVYSKDVSGVTELFTRKPDNGAEVQLTDGDNLAGVGTLPFSELESTPGSSTELVEGVINRYQGSQTTIGYITELVLPASPVLNQEFWMMNTLTYGRAVLLGNGNPIRQGLSTTEIFMIEGPQVYTGVKWNNGSWVFITTEKLWWMNGSTTNGTTSISPETIHRFRNNFAIQTLQLPTPSEAMEVWLKETSLEGGFDTTIETLGDALIEGTAGTFDATQVLPGSNSGYALHYKYDIDADIWRLLSFYQPAGA